MEKEKTDAAALAAMAGQRLRATPAALFDALGVYGLIPACRRLVKMPLEDLLLIEQLDQEIASLLRQRQEAIEHRPRSQELAWIGKIDRC